MLDFLYKQRFLPRLNIDSRSYDQLEALPAVGPTIAKRIIEYRKRTGAVDFIAGFGLYPPGVAGLDPGQPDGDCDQGFHHLGGVAALPAGSDSKASR